MSPKGPPGWLLEACDQLVGTLGWLEPYGAFAIGVVSLTDVLTGWWWDVPMSDTPLRQLAHLAGGLACLAWCKLSWHVQRNRDAREAFEQVSRSPDYRNAMELLDWMRERMPPDDTRYHYTVTIMRRRRDGGPLDNQED